MGGQAARATPGNSRTIPRRAPWLPPRPGLLEGGAVLVLDELRQRLIERRAAQLEADDGPLGVDQERGRDRADGEGLDEVAAATGVVDLAPGDLARAGEVEHGGL